MDVYPYANTQSLTQSAHVTDSKLGIIFGITRCVHTHMNGWNQLNVFMCASPHAQNKLHN